MKHKPGRLACFRTQDGNADEVHTEREARDAANRLFQFPLRRETAVIAVVSMLLITLFSKSSFLYPLNDWVDANCFFTVGKSILYGKVPYLDLYDQKGPILYFLHTIAALVSRTSFLGVYLIEIASCFVFLLASYQTVRLYAGRESLKWLVLMSVFAYTARSFFHGDSAEELSLPYLAVGAYLFFRSLRFRELRLSNAEGYVMGLCIGIIFWIKYTILGLYVGFALVVLFFCVRRREWKLLLRLIGMVCLGVATVSLPVLFYFWREQALPALLEVYFYNNIFGYGFSESSGAILNALHALPGAVRSNFFSLVCMALGGISLWRIRKQDGIVLYVAMLFTLFFALCAAEQRVYYSFVVQVFLPFGALVLSRIWTRYVSGRNVLRVVSAVLCCALAAALSATDLNAYLFLKSREEMPQYRFREIICRADDPTLLNYGFLDGGFYTVCDIVPTERFFCTLNMNLEEMDESMEDAIRNGRTAFVVTRDRELESDLYQLVDTETYVYEHQDRVYRLYERIGG